uniref:G-protein coupled receptors family 1 profile domain-containing protein n=1 Tax=Sinocyclocheilus grahami TaxID=75366 RepID=A0A672R2U6_SINGR
IISKNTGIKMTSSNLADSNRLLETIKSFVHFGAFIVTGLFTCLIIATVRNNQQLHQNPRYILLCQHCICVTGFNIMGAVVHALRSLRWPVSRITCWILFDLQVVMARGLMITLTLMSISTCLSICMPLRYPILVQRFYLLLLLLVLLIIISYVAIYLEGRRAGHFTRSNSKGRRTILIHSLQMSLHILPSLIIISRHQEALPIAVSIFILFSFAQSLSPVVFGLRCKELYKDMPQFLSKMLP